MLRPGGNENNQNAHTHLIPECWLIVNHGGRVLGSRGTRKPKWKINYSEMARWNAYTAFATRDTIAFIRQCSARTSHITHAYSTPTLYWEKEEKRRKTKSVPIDKSIKYVRERVHCDRPMRCDDATEKEFNSFVMSELFYRKCLISFSDSFALRAHFPLGGSAACVPLLAIVGFANAI